MIIRQRHPPDTFSNPSKNQGGIQVFNTYKSDIYLGYFVCVCVCVCVCVTICVGTLCYSFSFNNQTDQGDETEGLEREGLEMER